MFSQLILFALQNMLFLALHITNSGSFPKPLSAKEERACFALLAEGDREARNKLVEHNLRLVAHIIKKYYSASREQDDLISIGTIGLIKAVGTFDYQKGTRFATYASKCIENEILMYFRSLKKTSQEVSISEPIDIDKDGNSLTLMDIVSDEVDVIDQIDFKIKADQLYELLEQLLSERERRIITLRYGLYGQKPLTQREVAKALKISRSYVSRIEKKALQLLRRRMDLR